MQIFVKLCNKDLGEPISTYNTRPLEKGSCSDTYRVSLLLEVAGFDF